jgi:hypothetical protein
MLNRTLLATVTVFLTAFAADGFAQDTSGPHCGTFDVTIRYDKGSTVDNGPGGPSTGDQRILRYLISDAGGKQLGQMLVTATVMPQRDDRNYDLHSHLVHTFPNGTIVSVESPRVSAVLRPEISPNHTIDGAVTGGTGAFAGATGTTSAKPVENGVYRKTFNIRCRQ